MLDHTSIFLSTASILFLCSQKTFSSDSILIQIVIAAIKQGCSRQSRHILVQSPRVCTKNYEAERAERQLTERASTTNPSFPRIYSSYDGA